MEVEWYVKVLKQYFVFQGRARRKEYWMFVLISFIISIVLAIIENILGIASLLTTLYSLAVFLPSLGVSVRRLHDTGRSGWWILLVLIPLIGPLIVLVLMCFDSEPGTNRYGPNPKESEASSI